MKTKYRYDPTLAAVAEARAAGEALKQTKIPEGHVRVERHTYSYSQQGQATLVHYDCVDVPEFNAIHRINGQLVNVTWPDGSVELYDLAVTPCRVSSAIEPSFGEIPGITGHVKLSKLPNVAFDYYRAIVINDEQRKALRAPPARQTYVYDRNVCFVLTLHGVLLLVRVVH